MKLIINLKIILTATLIFIGFNLFAQDKTLKEVAIKANKPTIKQEADRITYDLQADPQSKFSSVLEMMRKVPFVTVDGNENIMLKGNTSYKILINGKPSSLMERDAKSILRSMPASTIQRIEVYTTPPAKYDAEGLGGIINIITNKKLVDGYNGTLNINERTPTGPGAGTSFTAKAGKLGLSVFGGGNLTDNPATTTLNTRTTTGANPTNLIQQGSTRSDNKNGYLGTELSYEINPYNLVSAQFNINGSRNNGFSDQVSVLNQTVGPIAYNIGNDNDGRGKGLDAGVNYQLGFKNDQKKLLTFSYRYFKYTNSSHNDIAFSNRVNYTDPDYNQDNTSSASEHTAQVDLVKGFKQWTVEAGVKSIFRDNSSDFQSNAFNPVTGNFDRVTALSNTYNSTQNILAAYNTWRYASKKLEVKAGVRLEHTTTDADFISTSSAAHQRYLNLLPSIAINIPLDVTSGLNLGFSQRLKRPGINKLNPFVDRSNPNFYSSGNPGLSRSVVSDLRLGYSLSKKANFNVSVFYDFGKNLDLLVSTLDPATNVTYSTYKNTGSVFGIGNAIAFNYPIAKGWDISINTNFMYFKIEGPVDGGTSKQNFVVFSSTSSTNYNINDSWRVGASVSVNGRNPTGLQGSTNGSLSPSVYASKQLIKNKLSLSASVSNPFTKYRNTITETKGTNFAQTVTNQNYFRTFNFSLNYNFGKLKESIKKTKRGINNDDGSR
ncbi:outer membrane beta-barrel protein [Mucilaginibacter sp. UR6-11]|uniref:outer membrane beta-barrel protein n=1 Tax=Mucilaginibacter sp. UR6-11 TaxID=1435644 RepID=UPI001E5C58E9|nr:outer membrane beta-barrel protein [Mucilaginibacter sp. UR6-11]MCC8424632.1 TonB-dependent receptor [Mucilaginibacter sp. UR6-11]